MGDRRPPSLWFWCLLVLAVVLAFMLAVTRDADPAPPGEVRGKVTRYLDRDPLIVSFEVRRCGPRACVTVVEVPGLRVVQRCWLVRHRVRCFALRAVAS